MVTGRVLFLLESTQGRSVHMLEQGASLILNFLHPAERPGLRPVQRISDSALQLLRA